MQLAQWDDIPIGILKVTTLDKSGHFGPFPAEQAGAVQWQGQDAKIPPVLQPVVAIARLSVCAVDVDDCHVRSSWRSLPGRQPASIIDHSARPGWGFTNDLTPYHMDFK